jgi:ATP-dependent Clp protease ATP-binding subunit ClpX
VKTQQPRVRISASRSATTIGEVHCSFCGKSREQVRGIVAGPTPDIAICNECVDLCVQIFAETSADAEAE